MKIILYLILSKIILINSYCWPSSFQAWKSDDTKIDTANIGKPRVSFCTTQPLLKYNDIFINARVESLIKKINVYVKASFVFDQSRCDVSISFLQINDAKVLGYFSPSQNEIVIDPYKTKTEDVLHKVLVHEMLHALGLGHNYKTPYFSIMGPTLNPNNDYLIYPQDVVALQQIFGSNNVYFTGKCIGVKPFFNVQFSSLSTNSRDIPSDALIIQL